MKDLLKDLFVGYLVAIPVVAVQYYLYHPEKFKKPEKKIFRKKQYVTIG